MHNLRSLARLICIMGLFASCDTELPLPSAAGDEKIVLLGELSAGDSVSIRAGQSVVVSSGSRGQQLIEDLSLTVKEGLASTTALSGTMDALSYTLFTLQYSTPLIVQANKDYQMAGKHPRLAEVIANVHIPGAFTAVVADRASTTFNGDSVLSLDIDLADPEAAKAQYVIEVVKQPVGIDGYFIFNGTEYSIVDSRHLYDSLKGQHIPLSERYDTSYSNSYIRQQMYTTDISTMNLAGAPSGRLFRRVFLSGKSFSGATHRTQILLPRSALYPESGQFALTVVYIKSVSADYFEFLKAYEQYDPSMGIGGNASPVELKGNVLGGFGMVGGVYKWKLGMIY